ncbi:alpha/beta fold hydrolase [Nitratifractor sp.]
MASRIVGYRGVEYPVAYEMLNPSQNPTILWLHGWGSHKELMRQAFGGLLPGWRQIYVDMPGFGKSPNDRPLTTDDYAGILTEFLRSLQIVPDVIAGHSFGGKVATLLDPPCLVLLSSAGIVVPKPFNVRAKIALFKLFKPLGGGRLRSLFVSDDAKGMNPGMYETFKQVVDEDFTDRFAAYGGRALLFWGKEDTATPLWTGERIAGLIGDARLEPMEGDHYFFLRPENAVTVAEAIADGCADGGMRG